MRGVLSWRRSCEGFSRTAISIWLVPSLLVTPPLIPPVTQIVIKKWRASIEQYFLCILALTKRLFRLRIACELFRHFREFTHAKTARLPGRSLETRLQLYIGGIYPELIDRMLPPSSIWSMLTMTAPAWVIWIYACASYWPGQMRKWVGVVGALCWIMSSWKSLAINKFYLQSPIWNCHKSKHHGCRFSLVFQNESLNDLKLRPHKMLLLVNDGWQWSWLCWYGTPFGNL